MYKHHLLIILFAVCPMALFAQLNKAQTDPYIAFRRGMQLFEQEQYSAAQVQFELVSSASLPAQTDEAYTFISDAEYYHAVCAVELYNPDADRLLIRFLEERPGNPHTHMAWLNLGKFYYRNKKYGDAISYLRRVDAHVLDRGPKDDYTFMLAYSYFNKKRLSEARPLFSLLKDKQTKYYYPANYYYGFIALEEGDLNVALESFERVREARAYERIIPYYLCRIYYEQGKFEELIAYGEPFSHDSKQKYDEQINHLIGQAWFALGNYTEALPYLQYYIDRARKLRPEDYYQLAYAQHNSGQAEAAIATFAKMNFSDSELGQSALFTLGDAYIKAGERLKARDAFSEAANMDYDASIKRDALLQFAKLSFELGYTEASIQSLRDYLNTYAESPNLDEAYGLLAEAFLHTRNFEAALQIFSELPAIDENLKGVYQKVTFYRGLELFSEGNKQKASQMLSESLSRSVDPLFTASSNFWLGEIAFSENDFALCIQKHAQFQQLAPVNRELPGGSTHAASAYTSGYAYIKNADYASGRTQFAKCRSELDRIQKPDRLLVQMKDDAALRQADCNFVLRRYNEADALYGQIVQKAGASADYAQFQRAMIYGLQDRSNDKINALQALNRNYPKSRYIDDALFEIGNTHLVNGRASDAAASFDKLLLDRPNSPLASHTLLKLGLIWFNEGNNQKSLAYYKQVTERYKGTDEAREALDAIREISVETGDPTLYTSLEGVSDRERDSVTYYAAYTIYARQDYTEASSALSDYLQHFRSGLFAIPAHFYRAECYFRSEDYGKALADYEYILGGPRSKFTETATLKAARIAFFKQEDYTAANKYYGELLSFTETESSISEALQGLMRANNRLGNDNEAAGFARQLIALSSTDAALLAESNYILGFANYNSGKLDDAFAAFKKAADLTTNEYGVESRFMMARIHLRMDNLEAAKSTALQLINETPAYEKWVIRSYILISDVLVIEGNYAQARASLRSIVENYTGDPSLVALARQKLDEVLELEGGSSRLEDPADQAEDMEMDSLQPIDFLDPQRDQP